MLEPDVEKNAMEGAAADLTEALSPATLPCGITLPNKFVKAPTYEHLASFGGGVPNDALLKLYDEWGQGRWGMVITGNVQVSSSHLSLGADMIVPEEVEEAVVDEYSNLARTIKQNGTLAIMQLSHSGRQSPNFVGGRMPLIGRSPLSASSTKVGGSLKDGLGTKVVNSLLFQQAREMGEDDIADVTSRFVRGAQMAQQAGFDGVELHAAHGYLLAQFISRGTNHRTDEFAQPLVFLRHIFNAIRSVVLHDFAVGIKLNSSDYSSGGLGKDESITHLKEIAQWDVNGAGVDFIEISGGDYEKPDFMTTPSPRQALFEDFSAIAVHVVESVRSNTHKQTPLVMLTGGLRTRSQFSKVLAQNHAHLLGIARLAILQPSLPRLLLEASKHPGDTELQMDIRKWENERLPNAQIPNWWPRLVGAGVGVAWYNVAMRRLAYSDEQPGRMHPMSVVLEMFLGSLWLPRLYLLILGAFLGMMLEKHI